MSHPLLFSINTVISPFTQYAGLIPPAQIAGPLVVVCLFALLLYVLLRRTANGPEAAVAMLSPMLCVFFTYGLVYEAILNATQGTQRKGPLVAVATLAIVIALAVYVRSVRRLHEVGIDRLNRSLAMVAGAVLVTNALSISAQQRAFEEISDGLATRATPAMQYAGPRPDIYFVLLDEYAAPSQMQSYFQYDMSPFIDHLRQERFKVSEMTTDQLGTAQILDARLNMKKGNAENHVASSGSFMDTLSAAANILSTDDEERMIRIRKNEVYAYLSSMGYQIVHMGSWLAETRSNRLADRNVNGFGFPFRNELSMIVANNSAWRLAIISKYFHRAAVLDSFAAMKDMPLTDVAGRTPWFVFSHIISPHEPYVFGANGEHRNIMLDPGRSRRQLYLDQHIYVTKLVKEFVDHMKSRPEGMPVIVIQADHGARMDRSGAHQVFTAVHIPDDRGSAWPAEADSVDTFRILFSDLFGRAGL